MEDHKPEYELNLLERMIQRHLSDQMKQLDDAAIAEAIQTLLSEEDDKVQNIH